MINNFELIKPLLDFPTPLSFYHVQILKRRKDNPDMLRDMEVIEQYAIWDHNDFIFKYADIMATCIKYNARAYINLNVRDQKKVALVTMNLISTYILNEDYKAVKNAFWRACGTTNSQTPKRWIVDIDTKDESILIKYIDLINTSPIGRKIIAIIPTVNGKHIISEPFNVKEFRESRIPAYDTEFVDIHKDHPTILYVP